MAKATGWIVGVLAALALLVIGIQMIASETGEVVVLTTLEPEGEPVETRLWVVDHQGDQYLRAKPRSGWYRRLLAGPAVRLRRGGHEVAYHAVPAPELRDVVNRLMREKYRWRDRYISLLVGTRDDAVPIRMTSPTGSLEVSDPGA